VLNIQWNDIENLNEPLTLNICDAAGKVIIDQAISGATAGVYALQFNSQLSSGFYIVRLQTSTRRAEKKLLVN
jgi:hypothetical protein